MLCAPRTRIRGGDRTHVHEKRRQRKGKEGVKERGPEGHLSISAGVKWAGACAVLLRTAALSLTPDAAGAAHPCTANVEATAGVPHRDGGVHPFALDPFDLRSRTCLSGASTATTGVIGWWRTRRRAQVLSMSVTSAQNARSYNLSSPKFQTRSFKIITLLFKNIFLFRFLYAWILFCTQRKRCSIMVTMWIILYIHIMWNVHSWMNYFSLINCKIVYSLHTYI